MTEAAQRKKTYCTPLFRREFRRKRFFLSLDYSKKPQGRNLKCQIFIQHFFKIVLHWCLDLICHNVDTPFKQFSTEFAGSDILFHFVYMWERTKFLDVIWLVNTTNQIARAAFTCKQNERGYQNWQILLKVADR